MHLLFTDPATSPRTELGRIFYGVLYGLTHRAAVRLAAEREHAGVLRQAAAGAAAESVGDAARPVGGVAALKAIDPSAWAAELVPRRRHLAYMGVWAVAFAAMSASGHLGDKIRGNGRRSGSRRARPIARRLPEPVLPAGRLLRRMGPRGRVTSSASCWPSATTIAPSRRRRSSAHALCDSPPAATTRGHHERAACCATTSRRLRTTRSSCAVARARCGSRAGAALRARLRLGVARHLRVVGHCLVPGAVRCSASAE